VSAPPPEPFVDVHCHLLPGIDDGAASWDDTLAMARMAVADGTETIVVTPHQLGNFAHNDGQTIRRRTAELQDALNAQRIPLRVLPGADVRIEDDMVARLRQGSVLTLADRRRHVLLELPHELYFPLEPVLDQLGQHEMVGILSHPERNQGLLAQRGLIAPLVDAGCLMQLTAGSLTGSFGPVVQQFAEQIVHQGLAHLVATDAHGSKSRRPLMSRAFQRLIDLADRPTAVALCCHNPSHVAAGSHVEPGRRAAGRRTAPKGVGRWLPWRKAG